MLNMAHYARSYFLSLRVCWGCGTFTYNMPELDYTHPLRFLTCLVDLGVELTALVCLCV